MNGERVVALNLDFSPQPIDRQSPDQVIGGLGLAVEQEIVAICPHKEIEQAFALRRKQARPDGELRRHIVGDEALEETAHVFAGKPDDCSVG